MNIENAKKLLSAQDDGFKIKISSTYLDGFARLHENNEGAVLLTSSVYSDLNMERVHLHEISVYKEIAIEKFINWKDE